jgi:hypothetical protein
MPTKAADAPNTVVRNVHGLTLALPVGIINRPDRVLTPVQQELRDRLRHQLRR